MNKKEVQKRVLQEGEPLSLDLFTWDEDTNTFSSSEDGLVLDFSNVSDCTFNTGSYCTFNTSWGCTFNTGWGCTFNTGEDCTFNTGEDCTFDTGEGCTFDTGEGCVVVRRDVYEVIELKKGQEIKLNGYEVRGYTVVDEPSLSGTEVEVKVNGKTYKATIE